MNSSGSSSLGWGFFFSGSLGLSLPLSSAGLGWSAAVGHRDRGQAEVALQAGLELAEAAAAAGQVLGELPGEEVLIGGNDLGHDPRRVLVERVQAEQGAALRLPVTHLRGQDRADHFADRQRSGLLAVPSEAVVLPTSRAYDLLPVADEAGVEDHVAVDHLAGDAGWPAGTTRPRPLSAVIQRNVQ